MLKYLLTILILAILILFIFIKIKFQFWSIQPVFHLYDLHHWFNPNKIINPKLPTINKYINLIDIDTFDVKKCPENILENICAFIKANYLRSKYTEYLPDKNDILLYLQTINSSSFVSIYWDKSINEKNIIATISCRPMYITFKNKPTFTVNYIDNLTVQKDKRKSGIAPRLIQTHHYHIRHINTNNKICLFKREGNMTAIIPLTTYNTSSYDVNTVLKIKNNLKKTTLKSIIKINKTNFSFFKDEIKDAVKKFTLQVNIELTTLYTLILSNKIIIYCSIFEKKIHAFYIYRNTPSIIDNKYDCMELICSINNSHYIDDFLQGFLSSLKRVYKKYNILRLFIEETADNTVLVQQFKNYNISTITNSPTAFFLYNYAAYSLPPKECIFLY